MTVTASDQRVLLQSAAVLLQYPDDFVRGAMPQVVAGLAELPPGRPVERLLSLAVHLERTTDQEAQEHYVAVLDRKRRCCLYLTWWLHGETRRRGLALARLKQIYREHGGVLESTELPDYLPLVLEFAATVDLARGLDLLQEHRAGLELLRLAMLEVGTPYAAALEAVCALLPGVSPKDEREARALARNGPPSELVGLDGLPGLPGYGGGEPTFDAFIPIDDLGVRR